jgi:hypothetical protein
MTHTGSVAMTGGDGVGLDLQEALNNRDEIAVTTHAADIGFLSMRLPSGNSTLSSCKLTNEVC